MLSNKRPNSSMHIDPNDLHEAIYATDIGSSSTTVITFTLVFYCICAYVFSLVA